MTHSYDDAEPEEFVTIVGFGTTTLHTAVRLWCNAPKTPGVRMTIVTREAGKEPTTFGPADMEKLSGKEGFG